MCWLWCTHDSAHRGSHPGSSIHYTGILFRVSLGAAQGSSRGTGVTLWRVSIGVLRDLLASVVGVCHGVAPVVCSAPAWPCWLSHVCQIYTYRVRIFVLSCLPRCWVAVCAGSPDRTRAGMRVGLHSSSLGLSCVLPCIYYCWLQLKSSRVNERWIEMRWKISWSFWPSGGIKIPVLHPPFSCFGWTFLLVLLGTEFKRTQPRLHKSDISYVFLLRFVVAFGRWKFIP